MKEPLLSLWQPVGGWAAGRCSDQLVLVLQGHRSGEWAAMPGGRVWPASLGRAGHGSGEPRVQGQRAGVLGGPASWMDLWSQEVLEACVPRWRLSFTLCSPWGARAVPRLGMQSAAPSQERLRSKTPSCRENFLGLCGTEGLRWCCTRLRVFTLKLSRPRHRPAEQRTCTNAGLRVSSQTPQRPRATRGAQGSTPRRCPPVAS